MTKEQVKDIFNKFSEEVDSWSRVTLDEDEIHDIFIDNNNQIHFHGELTPYRAEDVKLIKYRLDENPASYAGNSVMIIFQNGDSIRIGNVGFCAVIGFRVYEDKDVLLQYASMTFKEEEPAQFQTWQDVIQQLDVCFSKADIDDFSLQQSEYGFADVFFDNDTLYISESFETPYKLSDIKHIQYKVCSEFETEFGLSDCVRITFYNGDYLDFEDGGEYSSYIKIGAYYHYFFGIENVAKRYALEMKAKELGVNENEFVIVDSTLIEYNGDRKDIFIPEGVETIEKQVFQHNDIRSVVFPSTLRRVCKTCFGNCQELVNVKMNDGLEVIEEDSFSSCRKLKRIGLPTSLKYIGSNAFFFTQLSEKDVVFPPDCEVESSVFSVFD